MPNGEPRRCPWANLDPLLRDYHDAEWGVPEWSSRALWEKLMLDGFQAGLSWLTILKKRSAFRSAFARFEPARVARFGAADVRRLLADPEIVRSRAKIEAVIGGARAYLEMERAGEPFAPFVWGFVNGRPVQGDARPVGKTPRSERLSVELKRRGFKFVGPVIVHAWMQATGLVNDHATFCFRRPVVRKLAATAPGRLRRA